MKSNTKLKTITVIAYYENSLLTGIIIDHLFNNSHLEKIVELNQVKTFIETKKELIGESFINLSLADLRSKVIPKEQNVDSYLLFFKDNAWFSGFFRSEIDGRIFKDKDYINYESPIADFYGWKISELSNFSRSSKLPKVFKEAKALDLKIISILKSSDLIATKNTWCKSIDNELVKLLCAFFNKDSIFNEEAKYFNMYIWDKENLIFDSFDPEEPARKDGFNADETLVYNNEIVFEFNKIHKHDDKWNVYIAAMSDEYQNIVNIGEEYDPAFYTVTCLNNLIEYLQKGIFDPKLYIHNC